MEGHEVIYILEAAPSTSDTDILDRALSLGLPVMTEDKDFADLVFERGRGSAGVILLRLKSLSSETKAAIAVGVVRDHAAVIAQSFIVVSPGRVRVRRSMDPTGS